MLPKPHRLQRASDVQHVRQQGQGWRHPLAILLVTTNELEVSRFAFAASRSVGKAVVRNRAKRLLRETVRQHLGRVIPGKDCLFIARQPLGRATFKEAETAVLLLLHRANLSVVTEEPRG